MLRFKVHFKSQIIEFPVDPVESNSLMDILDRNIQDYPFGCRSGSCGLCRTKIIKGYNLLEKETLTEADTLDRCNVSSSHRLMCRAQLSKNIDTGVLEFIPEEE